MKETIEQAIQQQQLPAQFLQTVEKWYHPLARNIAQLKQQQEGTILIGVQGCQGSGKSTLSHFLNILLEQDHQLSSVVLSVDDFYLTKAERKSLAKNIHPLLATRGVPGTHDISLAKQTISDLKQHKPANIVRFNKAIDDRFPSEHWQAIKNPVDIIILEGWCVGLPPQNEQQLEQDINRLEQEEDADHSWRQYVNKKLANEYQSLFQEFDLFIVLQAPSFKCVYNWRLLQEEKLISSLKQQGKAHDQAMSPEEIERFISHYQRLTEHALATLPQEADWVLTLNESHSIQSLEKGSKQTLEA